MAPPVLIRPLRKSQRIFLRALFRLTRKGLRSTTVPEIVADRGVLSSTVRAALTRLETHRCVRITSYGRGTPTEVHVLIDPSTMEAIAHRKFYKRAN